MKAKLIAICLAAITIAAGLIYIGSSSSTRDIPEDTAKKLNMTLIVEGDGETARVRYYELEEKAKEGFVELPFSQTVFTQSVKITASPGIGGGEVSCRIVQGNSGKVLDKAGPSSSVTCSYSTF